MLGMGVSLFLTATQSTLRNSKKDGHIITVP